MTQWKKTKYKVLTMKVSKNDAEIAKMVMIECDHLAECGK
jgi:hypothetical protein